MSCTGTESQRSQKHPSYLAAAKRYVYRGGTWNRNGIAVSQFGALPVTLYTGEKFDNNAAVVTEVWRCLHVEWMTSLCDMSRAAERHSPAAAAGSRSELPAVDLFGYEEMLREMAVCFVFVLFVEADIVPLVLPAVWCFCSSPEYAASVREIDQKLNVTNATLVKVPFDLDRWTKVAAERYPNGLPEPYSDDPTQWIFHGDPCRSVVWNEETKRTDHGPPRIDATVLHVAVARLLGYRWPAELDPEMRLAPEQREVTDDCRAFGAFADPDGIVCLPSVRGEPPAADRLRSLLASAYGDEWSTATERALLTATSPKPPKSLDGWLRDRFFQEHCKLFHNRPFIWHVWDGHKDGFHALVNYHRLAGPEGQGRRTLESLTYAYLNEWIDRQRTESQEGAPGADGRLTAALDLQEQLQRILVGEPPCDIFVRWRPLHRQAIGWEPNINDGIRLNIRPFMRAELRRGGRAGAGLLRRKPNIKWGKDRGKEPEGPRPRNDFPWFWGCPGGGGEDARTDFRAADDAEFDGSRWNDLHYTRSAKASAHQSSHRGPRP